MKTLIFTNHEYEAERIVKTDDSIVGYTDDIVVFKFSGISDFNGFVLADEQEFDEPPFSEIEQLKAQNLELRETLDFILTDLIPSLYE